MSQIFFFTEEISFRLENEKSICNWLQKVVEKESALLDNINFIFCSDEYLLNINTQYLKHDYYTDVISFDNSDKEGTVCGDIFISIDRVVENANIEKTDFNDELNRVIVHGALHLLGYKDKSEREVLEMRQKEDRYLSLLSD